MEGLRGRGAKGLRDQQGEGGYECRGLRGMRRLLEWVLRAGLGFRGLRLWGLRYMV